MKMKAILFYGPSDIQYRDVEVPELKPGEVLVKVDTALTCGTDVKTFRRGHPLLIKNIPSGFGHEFSGTIEAIGAGVVNFKPAQRVIAANSAPCNNCYYCRISKQNLCENLEFLNGAYAEYIVIPKKIVEQNMIILSDDTTFEQAAFTEPLAVVLHAVEMSDIDVGKTVGIVGLGAVGLLFVKLAKLKGARVIAVGRNPIKLKLAEEFGGADEIIDLTKYSQPDKVIKDLTPKKRGLDVAIEAVGLPQIWERAIALTRKGGTVNLFGGCEKGTKIHIDTGRLHYEELRIISTFHHTPHHVSLAFRYIANNMFDLNKLITERMPLKQLQSALVKQEMGTVIKVAIKPNS